MSPAIDPIVLEVMWTRMVSIAEDVGMSIARTGFSTVLRENHDYSCGVFDENGTMLAQSTQSATGHIGAMPYLAKELLRRYPAHVLEPGDVLITNDPWIGCGHSNDLYIGAPVFRGTRFVGMVITSAHQMDIGGRLASPDSREVYEEGILIPPLKFHRRGEPNEDIAAMIRLNVRFSDKVLGDIRAQVAATHVGGQRLLQTMDEYELETIAPVAEAIVGRTEERMRALIAGIPDGVYRGEAEIEEIDHNGRVLRVVVEVHVAGDGLEIDYTGTSPQVERPINCVLNYTRAYSVLGVKLALAPFLPNNEGSYRPIGIRAPEGSILNARFPAACHWRHFVGLRLPDLLFSVLAEAMPDKVQAGSGACPVWLFTMSGFRRSGEPFLLNAHAMGGTGARADKDGISAVTFPPNVRDIPAEIIETETALVVERRAYRPDSGGAGRFRGGLGEELEIHAPRDGDLDPERSVAVAVFPGRLREPAKGLSGGAPGATGEVLVNGSAAVGKLGQESRLRPGDRLTYRTPGGGGHGDPLERESHRVANDVRRGYVTREAAERDYGVVLAGSDADLAVDEGATRELRALRRRASTEPISTAR